MFKDELAGTDASTTAMTVVRRCDRPPHTTTFPPSRRRSCDPTTLAAGTQESSVAGVDAAADDTPPPDSEAGHVTGSTSDYPGFVERAFFLLDQTTRPRSWCLRLITWPYPLLCCSRHCHIYARVSISKVAPH